VGADVDGRDGRVGRLDTRERERQERAIAVLNVCSPNLGQFAPQPGGGGSIEAHPCFGIVCHDGQVAVDAARHVVRLGVEILAKSAEDGGLNGGEERGDSVTQKWALNAIQTRPMNTLKHTASCFCCCCWSLACPSS